MGNTQEKTRITYDKEYITKRLNNSDGPEPQPKKVEAYLDSMRKYELRLWTNALDLTLGARDHFYALAELDYKINAKAAANNEEKELKNTEELTANVETLEAELENLSERTITLAEKNSKQKAEDKLKNIQKDQATITLQKKQLMVQLNKLSDDLRQLYNERERIIHLAVGLPLDIQIKF
jgi:23S rRNA pseudoU1915 N3-methylase RlmH